MLAPAKLLSDWEKATFNTISVRDAFAAAHSAVVASRRRRAPRRGLPECRFDALECR